MKNKEKKLLFCTLCLGALSCILLCMVVFFLIKGNYLNSLRKEKKADYDYKSNACYAQRDTQFSMLPKEHADIVFAGDSITQRFEWQEYFPDKKIINRGIDSDVSLGLRNRVAGITAHTPDKVFLMIGINDLFHKIPNASTIENLQSVIDSIKAEVPDCKIYLQSVIPVKENVKIAPKEICDLNKEIEKLAEENSITYIDLYSCMADETGHFPYTVDGVHPTGDGYQIWMDQITSYVTE